MHRDTHTSTSLNLTLVLPKVEKQVLLDMAHEGARKLTCPGAVPLARLYRLFSPWKPSAGKSQAAGQPSDSTGCDLLL